MSVALSTVSTVLLSARRRARHLEIAAMTMPTIARPDLPVAGQVVLRQGITRQGITRQVVTRQGITRQGMRSRRR
jgi:hypothetical protein